MLNTQCDYSYTLVGLYPTIDQSICSTTGTVDMVQTNELLQTGIIGTGFLLLILTFYIAYKMSGGKTN